MRFSWKFSFDFGWFPGEDFAILDFDFLEFSPDFITVFRLKIFKFEIGIYLSKE